jgi:AraC-like DNA-binding protein
MLVASANQHLDQVYAVVDGAGARADGAISASWKRSATNFGVDPASEVAPRILTAEELKNYREKVEALIVTAKEELDHLYRIAGPAGYVVLLCDKHGVAVDHRGDEAAAARFSYWGTWVGGIWSEEAEGTNGIGTCIAERQPVTIHQAQHFRSRHIGLSCSDAPIFSDDGDLIGVLDISSIDPMLSEHSHNLAGPLVIESARAIEERQFRERFRRQWIVAVAHPAAAGGVFLLAVDRDQRIVGAERNARAVLSKHDGTADAGASLWMLFERDDRIFRGKDGGDDFGARLTPRGEAEGFPALITPPQSSKSIWRNSESARLHCRPRKDVVVGMPQTIAFPPSRGGLPPRALRRVQDYIDAHLNEGIELEELAATAGLSLHYFARAFKTSMGVPPHGYVLQRRVDKARDLLVQTDRSIADIALAAGFSDQSHLARHFRQSLGISPSAFRRSHR